jgi:hypothetical protein
MDSPPPNHPVPTRALRDLMPSVYLEIWAALLFWFAWFCRHAFGFDPLALFHRGGPAPAIYYFWCAIIFSAIAIWAITFKIHRARILQRRGIDTIGTITSTARRPRNVGWDAKVRYLVDGKEITVLRICETKTRPVDGTKVPVVYDPEKPDRSWVAFISRREK